MKLSIITINYNNDEGLKRTIESVTEQTIKTFEYIVIDGGSTDKSVDIINKYSDGIDYWISEPDKGIYNAMNKGIRQAKGEYLLFINSGDELETSESLSQKIRYLDECHDLIYFNLRILDKPNSIDYIKSYPDYLDFKYFVEDAIPHNGTFIKKQVLMDYGGYSEEMNIVSDWAFFMDAICIQSCSYKHIDGVLSRFYLDGISSDPNSSAMLWRERDEHLRKKYSIFYSFYKDYILKRQQLSRLQKSISIRFLKKLGLLKWLNF